MNLESYFNKLKSDFPDINLPGIFEAEDYNESQLKINGIWRNYLYGCGVIRKNDSYVYLETDQERGYISVVKEFENKESLEQYICNRFTIIANASRDSNSKEEMAVRFVQQKYKYSEKQSRRMVAQIAKHKEIFEEFFNYARVGRFCKKDKSQTQVHGYTAEFLSKEYNLSPLGAYNYLVYLIEDPERALADLKAGLPTKDSSRFEKFIDQEEVQGKMDEKITTPVEEIAEPQKTPAETPAEQTALLEKLDAVQQALAALQQTFNDKIAEDTHKNSLFDNMHRELVRYQNGALDKIVDTIALDIIQLVDTTKGHVRVYDKKEPTEENYKKLLRIVKGIAEDLEDILYRQNIESYRVPGHEVDTRHQKIIQTVPTDDKSKDNLIAVRAADGYEKGDKVLRPERIKIFKYEAPATKPTENN